MELQEYLKSHRLITDGAMGTYFEEKYGKEAGISELANTEAPEKIRAIHLEYLRSGAQLIRTNTFASNTMLLGSEDAVRQNILAGYQIAKEAILEYQKECAAKHKQEKKVFLAADLGPIYPNEAPMLGDYIEEQDVLEEYKVICDTFIECGAKVFVFETLSDFSYVKPVTEYIKSRTTAFILVQFAFDKSGYTKAGLSVSNMLMRAAELESVDACGFNCGVTAVHLNQLLQQQEFPRGKYVSALPNGSYPYELRGKTVYSNNENYFRLMMEKIDSYGMDIVGGCCGTKPSYIKELAQALENVPKSQSKVAQNKIQNKRQESAVQKGFSEKSAFLEKLDRGEKVFVVELDPPFGLDITKVLEGAKRLKQSKADLITLADSPMARTRMDALQLAVKVQNETGVHVMPHVCCRDKNMIAMRSGLLGAYMNDVRNFLFVTGDPVPRESREHVTSVFDFNSIKLMHYMEEMNQEIFGQEPVVYFGALNYHGVNVDAIITRMQKKMEAGCRGFLTQPVYSKEDMERILYLKEKTGATILCGIMPLVSYKNAMFIKNEMPGIKVTDEIVARYREDMTREEAEQAAIEVSLEIAGKLYDKVDGFYMMTPFNRAALVGGIIDAIKEKYQ